MTDIKLIKRRESYHHIWLCALCFDIGNEPWESSKNVEKTKRSCCAHRRAYKKYICKTLFLDGVRTGCIKPIAQQPEKNGTHGVNVESGSEDGNGHASDGRDAAKGPEAELPAVEPLPLSWTLSEEKNPKCKFFKMGDTLMINNRV